MEFKKFKKLFFCLMIFIAAVGTTKPLTYQDCYPPMENKFFSSYSLSDADKQFIFSCLNNLVILKNTKVPDPRDPSRLIPALSDIQLAYTTGLIQNNFLQSTMFNASDKGVLANYLSQLGVAVSETSLTGYQTLSTRINSSIASLSTATDINTVTNMVTQAQQYLAELPGSIDQDKAIFWALVTGLINRATAAKATSQVDILKNLQSKADNITASDKIAYLNRVTTPANFIDTAEKAFFKSTMSSLSEQLNNMSNDDLVNFRAALSTAYSSTNFTADEKTGIMAVSNNLDNFIKSRVEGGSTGSTTVSGTPDNFISYLRTLRSALATIKSQYKSGTDGQIQALSTKTTSFLPNITPLLSKLGDMITSDYLAAGGNPCNIPTPPSGILVDEQKAALIFFSQDVPTANTLSTDKASFTAIINQINAGVPSAKRLQYVNDLYTNTILSEENKIRMLWHLQYLIQSMLSTDPNKNLTTTQRTTLQTLISVLSRDSDYDNYKTLINNLMNLFETNSANSQAAFDVSSIVSSAVQAFNGQKVVIAWAYAPNTNTTDPLDTMLYSGQYLGAYNNNNIQVLGGYDLAIQNIFTPTLTSDGSFVLTSELNNQQITIVNQASVQAAGQTQANLVGTLSLANNATPISNDICRFFIEGSMTNALNIKSKGTNSYLTCFGSGIVRTTDPNSGAMQDNIGQSKIFTITALDQFALLLLAARKNTDPTSVVTAYQNAYQGLISASTSPDLFATYSKRLLADIKYFINSKLQSAADWQSFKQSPAAIALSSLLTTINSNAKFANYATSIATINSLLQQASGGTTSSASSVVASLVDENIIAIRYGRFDDPNAHYMIVEKESDGTYYFKAVCTTPADPAAQFKVTRVAKSNSAMSFMLESVLFQGLVVAYTSNRGSTFQDLDLITKPSSPTTNATFNIITSSSDPSSICLVNLGSSGYLSIDSNHSLVTTDFSQSNPAPFAELANSRFSVTLVNQFYTDLQAAVAKKDTLDLTQLQNILTNKNYRLDQEAAVSYLKEIYYWVYSKHTLATNDSWTAFTATNGLAPSLLNFLATLTSDNKFKQTFKPYAAFSDYIERLVGFTSGGSAVPLLPTNRGTFWLSESNFSFPSTGRWGIAFAMQTSGICHLYLADAGDATGTRYYEIRIGDLDASGNRQVVFFSSSRELNGTRVGYPNFNTQALVDLQVIFDNGNITLADANGTISSYKEPKYIFTGPSIHAGFSAEGFDLELENVVNGLDLYNTEFLDNLSQTPYSSLVSSIVTKLNSLTIADMTVINQAATIAAVPFRLEGAQADWTTLQTALAALAQKQFIKGNYTAKNQVSIALNSLNTPATIEQLKAYLENLYNIIAFYTNNEYSAVSAALTSQLQTIVTNNLNALIALSFQDNDKAYASDIISRMQSANLFTDPSALVSLTNNLNAQIQLALPTSGVLADSITYLQGQYPKIATNAQLSTIISMISTVVSNAKASGANIAPTDLANLSTLIDSISATTIFKQVLGSLAYLKDILVNSVSASAIVSSELSAGKDATTVITNLKNYVFKLVGFAKLGFAPIHSNLIADLSNQLTTAKTNALLASNGVDLDFMLGYLSSLGDINAAIASVNTNYGNISSKASRDLFLSKFDSMVISFLEYEIAQGTVNDAQRAAVNKALDDSAATPWFKDADAATKIANFRTRISAVANPSAKIDDMKARFANLTASQAAVDQYIADLTALSSQLTGLLAAGTWYDAKTIQSFNDLVDSIITKSNGNNDGAPYLIYVEINYGNPPLNLAALKVNTVGDMTLPTTLASLANTLANGTALETTTGRNTFMTDFRNLMASWKLMVIFDPSTGNIPNTLFKSFYTKFDQLLQDASNNRYLAPNKVEFDQARGYVIEDVFDPIEQANLLNSFFNSASESVSSDGKTQLLGGRPIGQIVTAVRGIVDEFIKYQAFHFDHTFNTSAVSSVLSFCQGKSSIASFTVTTTTTSTVTNANGFTTTVTTTASAPFSQELTSAQTAINSLPTIEVRVRILCTELTRMMANNEPLSNVQRDNIVAIVSSLATVLGSLGSTQGGNIDMTTLKNTLQQLNNTNYFTDPEDLANLNTAVTTISNINFATQTTPTSTSTTTIPTTTNTNVPTIAYGGGQVNTSTTNAVASTAPVTTTSPQISISYGSSSSNTSSSAATSSTNTQRASSNSIKLPSAKAF